MSGPYREGRAVEASSTARLRREKAPTRRLGVRAAQSGELVVRLRHLHRWLGTLLLVPCGLVCAFGGLALLASHDGSLDSPFEHGLVVLAVGIGMILGGAYCLVPSEELVITRSAVVRRRGFLRRSSEVVLLPDVSTFVVERTIDGQVLLLQHGRQTLPLVHEDKLEERLSDDQLEWLARRLRTALVTLREVA